MSRDTSLGILRTVVMWAAMVSITAVTGCIGCNDGIAAAGEPCQTIADCESGLQCLDHICKPGCSASEQCGEGFVCEAPSCRAVVSEVGDPCSAELDCGPGQSCRILESFGSGRCAPETLAAPFGAACRDDAGCRGGVCALGRCTPLCNGTCPGDDACTKIPRVSADSTVFYGDFDGCLPQKGNLVFDIPLVPNTSRATVLVPVPEHADSVMLVAEVVASTQLIGITRVVDHGQNEIYREPTDDEMYYTQPLRHQALPGIAVLQIPSTSAVELVHGVYTVDLRTWMPDGPAISTPRRLRVVEKLDRSTDLRLAFVFLDLDDHPCPAARGLNAGTAQTDRDFLAYVEEIRAIFRTQIRTAPVEFFDLRGHPDLDGPAAADIGDLFEVPIELDGRLPIYLVRSLSPAGLEIAVGGTPGSPLPGTRASGIAIAATALCYQSWDTLARQTAHAIARHMGLYRNLEPDGEHRDPLVGTPDDPSNLMYWGENGGTTLTSEQHRILERSPVLQ